jgi:hypothetical protein
VYRDVVEPDGARRAGDQRFGARVVVLSTQQPSNFCGEKLPVL